MTMTYLTLRLERRGPAAWIWMNRPEVHNAFDETLIADLTAAFAAVDADRDVPGLLLAGGGKSFLAGAPVHPVRRQGATPVSGKTPPAPAPAGPFPTLPPSGTPAPGPW